MQHRYAGHWRRSLGRRDSESAPISATSAAGIFAEGSRFGSYVIGPCIGHGEGGRIYRAQHDAIGKAVALEVFTGEFARSPAGHGLFLREARRAATVRHPSTVNLFDVGVQDGIPFLVREHLAGEELGAVLHSRGALDEAVMVDMMVPIVAGLCALHDAGIVHGGLETASVFLAQSVGRAREPKLLDFGISKRLGRDTGSRPSGQQGLFRGGVLYMAPEAARGEEASPWSDQYSLGVIMYECVTGVNPFMCDSRAEALHRIIYGEYLPLSRCHPQPSPALAQMVERAMHLDPAQRFPNLEAFGRELLTLASERTRMSWSLSFGRERERALELAAQPFRSQAGAWLDRYLGPLALRENASSILAFAFGIATFIWGIALLLSH